MKAVFNNKPKNNAMCMQPQKEPTDRMRLVYTYTDGTTQTAVDARFYTGRSNSASVVYCSLWISPFMVNKPHFSGAGRAGGYGYHKASAAMQEALSAAGVELWGSPYDNHPRDPDDQTKRAYIGGCGESSMRCALRAIGQAMIDAGMIHKDAIFSIL